MAIVYVVVRKSEITVHVLSAYIIESIYIYSYLVMHRVHVHR